MPFRPGDAKPPNSGRKKGSPAKPTTRTQDSKLPPPKLSRDVAARLGILGLDPIAGLVRVGVKAEEAGELGVAKSCYAELANYVYPKRRSTDLRIVDEEGQDTALKILVEYIDKPSPSADSQA